MRPFRSIRLDPPALPRALPALGVVALLLLGAFFWFSTPSAHRTAINIDDLIPRSQVNFAGEPVPFDEAHYFNVEKFDREIAVGYYSIYQIRLYHQREPLYIPHIAEKLKAAGIPDDFRYLPIAESALRNTVVSSASAAGIWQLMPDTARRYGLTVNDSIDERFHFERATDAAIRYLLDLHEKFDNWTLAAAAYNRGENGLQRDMDAQGATSYYDLYLNEETSRYVFRILAIKYLLENRSELYDARDLGEQFTLPKAHDVALSGPVDLMRWTQSNGVTYASIRLLNPWILSNSLPKGDWTVRILD